MRTKINRQTRKDEKEKLPKVVGDVRAEVSWEVK